MESPPEGEVIINSVEDLSDLPTILIVTSVPLAVFNTEDGKESFEQLFGKLNPVQFEYFRSFKRVRVTFQSPEEATFARIQCDGLRFLNVTLRCFFAQIQDPNEEEENDENLKPPPLEKQFLISPPSSPPVGWEQSHEATPIVNWELIARLSALGRDHNTVAVSEEIHPGSEYSPSIIVHTCPSESNITPLKIQKPSFVHTPCPPRTEA